MIAARLGPRAALLVLGPVRGLDSDAIKATAELAAFGPDVLGIGVSPEELRSLTEYFVAADAEPLVPLTANETSEVRGLVRFGEVRVPNPSIVQALRLATERSFPVEPLDPTDERYAALYTEHISYVELVRRTVNERSIARSPPSPSTPDEFALEWDAKVAGGAGSRRLALARDSQLATGAIALTTRFERVAVLVDRERFESVRSRISAGLGAAAG